MLAVYLIISALIVGLDQWVKYLTVANLALGESHEVVHGLFSFTYIQNTGAAWSILEGKMWFFFVITTVALVVICYLLWKHLHDSRWFTIGLSLVLAGALGNFVDRMRLGYVVDMFRLDFINFPIFNVADMSLVIGVICIFIYILKDEAKK